MFPVYFFMILSIWGVFALFLMIPTDLSFGLAALCTAPLVAMFMLITIE